MITIATETKAFFHGHWSFQGKHYSDFFFARLFKGMMSRLHKWWDSTLEKFTKLKIAASDITVLYLNEQKGWESLVEDYISTKGIVSHEALTKQMLDAPPNPQETRKIIWFILPAIASGNTTMKCLEYGSRYKPRQIQVSIIVARMDSAKLSFYQNITGYRHCDIEINMLSWMPIIAYPSAISCSLCDAEKKFDEILHKISEYEYLSKIVKRVKDLFECKEMSLELLRSDKITPATDEDKKRVLMRAHYEEARRDIGHRKEVLGPFLDESDGAIKFIEMVGIDFLSAGFPEQDVKRITYNRFEHIKREAEKYIDEAGKKGLSTRVLLGIYRLFPELLLQSIKTLFHNALMAENQQLCEDIVLLGLLNPEKYGVAIAGETDMNINTDWFKNLFRDIRQYPYWCDSESGYAVDIFLKLLWLLRRSTPWGSNIEYLRSVVHAPGTAFENIKKAFIILESQGIKDVLHYISELKGRDIRQPGGLWSAIVAEKDKTEETVVKIEEISKTMKNIVALGNELNKDDLLKALSKLDEHGRELTSHLNCLFTNPIDLKLKIEALIQRRWPRLNIDIRFTIARDQPGVLIGLEDFTQSIIHIIDNAAECMDRHMDLKKESHDNFWLEFKFTGYTNERSGTVMLIRDNLPWKEGIIPTGGMKQFAEYCRKYAAIYDFTPQIKEDNYVKMKVIYKVDDKKERYGYQ